MNLIYYPIFNLFAEGFGQNTTSFTHPFNKTYLTKVPKSIIMHAVYESEEPHDIGVCPEHNRVFECYSLQSYKYFMK